jgi:flagellar basal-body rod protein FlgB
LKEFLMSIQISRAHDLMKAAMDYRAVRQDMIASNIANADTPYYRPRDIRFEGVLAQKQRERFAGADTQLEMARTDAAHLGAARETSPERPTVFYRDGHGARNDGNSVDLDVETTEMAKNSGMFNALTAAMRKDSMIFKSVLEASAKTQ